jgi:hypothetical protein
MVSLRSVVSTTLNASAAAEQRDGPRLPLVEGAATRRLGDHMLGQLAFVPEPVDGAVGVVGVVAVAAGVVVVVDVEPVAALAIAAPPPAITPVAARATSRLRTRLGISD